MTDKTQISDKAYDHLLGHRARLRKRILGSDDNALLDHELIEYLLATAIPRRDTKPLAKALIAEFGSLQVLMAAPPEALRRVPGMGDSAIAAIRIAHLTALRLLRSQALDRPVLASWQALLDYLRADMAHHTVERVRVLHLNVRNILIRDELVSQGSIDQVAVHVREIIRRAIDLGSSSLILVHNHPSGDPSPSKQDIVLTRDVVEAGKRLGIMVHDHLIMAADGHVSLRAMGLV